MRVVIAPDRFFGALTATAAARAIADGWRETAPDDELVLAPLSDGGPGFLDAVHAAVGGSLLAVTVEGPTGEPVPATVLVADGTAYVESAQACGPELLAPAGGDPMTASSHGVGLLLLAALSTGARRVVVGVGDSATNDAGAGLLAALGARVLAGDSSDGSDPTATLVRGGGTLGGVRSVDLDAARERVDGVELVVASDVDNPLAGPGGTSMAFAVARGASHAQAAALDTALQHWARVTDEGLARAPGAGSGGGIGHALLLLGAARVNAVQAVMDLAGVDPLVAAADLAVTGELLFDHLSLRGKVPAGVARVATRLGRPTIVLAGIVEVGRREMATMGVESAYAMAQTPAELREATRLPAQRLADLSRRVARTWSRAG